MTHKTVTIFGVFDGVHEGHREFIKAAKEYGDHLVAIVARDSVVEKLKDKTPEHSETFRIKMLLEVPEIDLVYLGDAEEGTYKMLKEVHPDVVYLGYDQQELQKSLENAIRDGVLDHIEIIMGEPYKPDEFHSSILKKKK